MQPVARAAWFYFFCACVEAHGDAFGECFDEAREAAAGGAARREGAHVVVTQEKRAAARRDVRAGVGGEPRRDPRAEHARAEVQAHEVGDAAVVERCGGGDARGGEADLHAPHQTRQAQCAQAVQPAHAGHALHTAHALGRNRQHAVFVRLRVQHGAQRQEFRVERERAQPNHEPAVARAQQVRAAADAKTFARSCARAAAGEMRALEHRHRAAGAL